MPAFKTVATSHSLTSPSIAAVARVLPSGEKATPRTLSPTPRLATSSPLGTSHIFKVWSTLPAATSLPSGEKATLRSSLWVPLRIAFSRRSATSQSRTVVSMLPVTSVLSSGEKTTPPRTPCSCPCKVASSAPAPISQFKMMRIRSTTYAIGSAADDETGVDTS